MERSPTPQSYRSGTWSRQGGEQHPVSPRRSPVGIWVGQGGSSLGFIHGIYPRSESLVTATQGLDRGRLSAENVTALQAEDSEALVSLQGTEGLLLIEDGKITWQDIFRPFVATSKGFKNDEDGEIVRWFDNNSFFRRPVITGRLIPDFSQLDRFFPPVARPPRWKVTLPSPFTFAKLCEDQTTDRFEGTLENVTQLMKETIEHLEARGVSFVQFNEPYIPYYGSQPPDIDGLVASLKSLGLRNRAARFALYSFFGDCAPLVKRLEEEGVVEVVGVDFLKTQIEDLPTSMNQLIAGVVDGRNSDIESADELSRVIDQIREHTRPRVIYITHNTDLEFLPDKVAQEKVKLIGVLNKL